MLVSYVCYFVRFLLRVWIGWSCLLACTPGYEGAAGAKLLFSSIVRIGLLLTDDYGIIRINLGLLKVEAYI